MREAFLTKTRHDLCTPINAIMGYSEMLMEDAQDDGDEEQAEDLERIHKAGQALLAKVRDLLNPALIQSGELDLANIEALGERVHLALRSDISTVIGYSEMLIEDTEGTPAAADLEKIRLSGTRLTDLIQQLISCAGIVGGHEGLIPAADLADQSVQEIAESLRALDDRQVAAVDVPGKLLVVDDDEMNRDILARQLTRFGHQVVLAVDGPDALRRLEESEIELVLLDLFMPGMNGHQVLERIKSHSQWQHIPVIMLSAAAHTESIVRCIEAGADDYVVKPANPILLRARTIASLERKRLRDREQEYLQQLQVERDKSERLLLNILPAPIAERLKSGQETIADAFDEVTVVFSDLVGFTNMSARLSPELIVDRLNKIFQAFDALAARHGVEKIKTIGDAYMAVAGIPTPTDDHAERVAELALDMLDAIEEQNLRESETLQMRIGINTGPVVAGVIGTSKFAYDLWGDTVNTASRMESSGIPGKIQISSSTRALLGSKYKVAERGTIEIKGKGTMTTYLLTGRHPVDE